MLKEPLQAAELQDLARAGGTTVADLINRRSAVFKKMGVDRAAIDEDRAIELVQSNPRILLRPLIQGPGLFMAGFSAAEYAKLL